MIELTKEQHQAIEQCGDQPARLVDPETGTTYVLLREDVYGRVRSLLGADLDPRETYPAVDAVFCEDWDDPKMAEYDRYEEHRP